MFNGNHVQLGKKSNSVIMSRSVMVKNWCNVLSMEGVTVCGHHPECRVTLGRVIRSRIDRVMTRQTKGQRKNIHVLYMYCMLLRNIYIQIEIWS